MAMWTGGVTTPFESELLLISLRGRGSSSTAWQREERSCGGKNGGRGIEL